MTFSSAYPPPSRHIAQPYARSEGGIVLTLMQRGGLKAIHWQSDVLQDWSAMDERGKVIHKVCLLACPRQQGKSVDLIGYVIKRAMRDGYRVLWTEHNYSTTCEMLRRFKGILGSKKADKFARYPGFNRHVANYSSKISQEAYFFDSGGAIHFATRTKSAALGYSFDLIIIDEAQELAEEHVQILLPTLTSGEHHDSQVIYAGTPSRAGSTADSFARIRENVIAGTVPNACLWEWGVDEIGDVTDETRWKAVNPSLAEGVADIEAIRTNLATMSPLTFAQEHLGYWLPRAQINSVIPADKWEACATTELVEGDTSFGVKFARDGSRAALSACIKPESGKPYVELIKVWDMGAGMRPIADWIYQRIDKCACVVMDGVGQATNLATMLRDMGAPRRLMIVPTVSQCTEAYALMLDRVNAGEVTHYNQAQLNAAATTCARREIGKGWGFEDTETGDATLIESASLALWGALTTKRKPGRKTEAYF